ncbi:alkaline phosphatase family protein [Limnoglobus roseus]|uniref:Phospholipase C n=1 Tax=Limnoglobus roseus TaxID=2598579 RepID=A0A5C1AC78_9BACT|nr:alkaline phosphatase family protein [Limnoglobus roseus]QEL15646.1 hypothetical protein PX52LOC_02581 [Limnoglobus roseus]
MRLLRPAMMHLEELDPRVLPRGGLPVPDHVVIVVEENHGFDQIRGNPDAAYFNALADGPHAALLTQSFAVEHPSQPNYLDLFSGSNQGTRDDAVPAAQFVTPNLGASLIAAGKTFVGYSEDLPAVGSLIAHTGGSDGLGTGAYWRKHNPWSDWQGSSSNGLAAETNQPFTAFPTDYANLPTVAFVVPNQAHDMHDGTVAQADVWLRDNLGEYADWAVTHNSLLVVTFDEDDSAEGNQIFTVVVGGPVRQGQYEGRVDHFGVLRTVEDFYDLPYAGASATTAAITGIWATPAGSGYAAGSDVGGGSATLYGADGTAAYTVQPFGAFSGGVRVAVADFNGDGVGDLVTGTGPGIATRVVVLDGANAGHALFDFAPFEASFTGGVFVAAGDLTGDGVPELVVTPDEGGGPRVRVLNGNGFAAVDDFFGIDDPAFRGGARATVGDLDGDGVGDLIVAAGFGGGPRVAGFSGRSLGAGATRAKVFGDFFAFEATLRNGVYVAVGDVSGDGVPDLVVGAGPGGGPRVSVLDGVRLRQNQLVRGPDFFAGDATARGGVRVAVKDLDGDPFADLVVGDGTGGGRVRLYDRAALTAGPNPVAVAVDPFPGFTGGVFVG